MARTRYKPEEIVAKLRQVDVLTSQGQTMADAIRQIGVREVTYYRWRQEYGGLKIEQVKRLKELELENTRLRKAVSDLFRGSRSCRCRPLRGGQRCGTICKRCEELGKYLIECLNAFILELASVIARRDLANMLIRPVFSRQDIKHFCNSAELFRRQAE
jgi:putative transposase